jgi:hypothetical protein
MYGGGMFGAPAFGAANPLGAGGGKQGQTLLMRASAHAD